jgi:nucleolar protein 4
VLHGRTLDLARAVTRTEADKLREAGERAREKADKRNLYLLREGVVFPNSPAASQLPATELEKRTNSFEARKKLLRSNPSLFVSKTRLSVRQLPLFVTPRVLKRLALHAVREFEDEVKAGKRASLTQDELRADEALVDLDAGGGDPDKKRTTRKGRHTAVKQAKVVTQGDRIDTLTGKARSKGYGFVELHTHADALRVLRWANNNPAVLPLLGSWFKEELKDLVVAEEKKANGGDKARVKRIREELEKGETRKGRGALIVEFSIENIQVVQRRATKEKEIKAGVRVGSKTSCRQYPTKST